MALKIIKWELENGLTLIYNPDILWLTIERQRNSDSDKHEIELNSEETRILYDFIEEMHG